MSAPSTICGSARGSSIMSPVGASISSGPIGSSSGERIVRRAILSVPFVEFLPENVELRFLLAEPILGVEYTLELRRDIHSDARLVLGVPGIAFVGLLDLPSGDDDLLGVHAGVLDRPAERRLRVEQVVERVERGIVEQRERRGRVEKLALAV